MIGLDLVELVSSDLARVFALAQHFTDQIVGQHQFGVGKPVEIQPDRAFSRSRSEPRRLRVPPATLEAAAAVDQLVGLDLGLIASKAVEILQPGQGPVDARAGDLKRIGIHDRVFDIQTRRHGGEIWRNRPPRSRHRACRP